MLYSFDKFWRLRRRSFIWVSKFYQKGTVAVRGARSLRSIRRGLKKVLGFGLAKGWKLWNTCASAGQIVTKFSHTRTKDGVVTGFHIPCYLFKSTQRSQTTCSGSRIKRWLEANTNFHFHLLVYGVLSSKPSQMNSEFLLNKLGYTDLWTVKWRLFSRNVYEYFDCISQVDIDLNSKFSFHEKTTFFVYPYYIFAQYVIFLCSFISFLNFIAIKSFLSKYFSVLCSSWSLCHYQKIMVIFTRPLYMDVHKISSLSGRSEDQQL